MFNRVLRTIWLAGCAVHDQNAPHADSGASVGLSPCSIASVQAAVAI
ncbi:hypothetical protein RBWH47_05168 [Rhodopirellula baltica WH47]|uniref:Uncharacterized protein n=1 Tax=Rhodopirellula baltica WH47 TaxID=991778 RepID=F2AXS8_RHOBT|nr:hypothetical protein RBWH47_05168 [Rhodopirellula baltica WH47]